MMSLLEFDAREVWLIVDVAKTFIGRREVLPGKDSAMCIKRHAEATKEITRVILSAG